MAAYAKAMGRLTRRYPDDLDAATLYAESALNLRPWKLWAPDGTPAEGTEEIVRVLETVLGRDPDHSGANHYYIHAVEASPTPERALPSAARLATLAPAAGHLVHMPAHIFMRVGDYEAAARANERAIVADRAYLKRGGAPGIYPMMYYSHNMHFLAVARATQGRFADAKRAADDLVAHVGPHLQDMPMLEGFLPTPALVLVRFRRWDDVLAGPKPAGKPLFTTVAWHFARGMAHAARGELAEAEMERKAFLAARRAVPADAMYGAMNKAHHVFGVAEGVLAARIAVARKDMQTAIALLRKAVRAEDALHYTEPPDWFLHVRETLGGVLLQNGDAAGAEKVFRDDLQKNRRNGRSLFGLAASLDAQKKEYAARAVRQEFQRAWRNADPQVLRAEEL
jgi:tetratricopeptide (TPR) repeat protein